ncbi:MAG: CRTAC1 family protein [Hyphomonadaceae bacterium]|nr:CRTAC1 family protein [Hyphomonadaceae bacterium]
MRALHGLLPAAIPLMLAGMLAGILAACASAPAAEEAVDPAAATVPVFTSVQPELFGVVGSLSNAWGDFDNDGDIDLAVSLKSGEVRLYRNTAGAFASAGKEMGLPQSGHELRGLSWGDFDGDGDIDLLGGSTSPDNLTYVFRNDGGKAFIDVAADIGLTIPGRSARQTNWIDYDNDGDLDLYSGNRMGGNKLFNNAGGKFTELLGNGGPSDTRPTVGACWFDMERDGDLDLFLANQSGATDAMWRNDGATFVDVAPALGMDAPGRTREEGGVGCAIGDYDNDGDFDVFVPSYGHNLLYRNDGGGKFTSVGKELGVGVENHAVGAAWGDYDNDGDLDLSVIAYEGPNNAQTPLNKLFRNDGAAGFVDVLTKDSLINAGDHGVEWVDYDMDGGLDLALTDGYGPDGGHFVFRNDLPEPARKRSLSVMVLDSAGHFTRAGAEVRLLDASGKVIASRQVLTGGGYNTQSAIPVYFGLAKTSPVTVEVTFMGQSGPKSQRTVGVRPANYAGKSLIVRQAD